MRVLSGLVSEPALSPHILKRRPGVLDRNAPSPQLQLLVINRGLWKEQEFKALGSEVNYFQSSSSLAATRRTHNLFPSHTLRSVVSIPHLGRPTWAQILIPQFTSWATLDSLQSYKPRFPIQLNEANSTPPPTPPTGIGGLKGLIT